jgi:hypothetical protein
MAVHLKICAAYQLDIAQAHTTSGDIRSLFQGVNMKAASGDRMPKNITQELVEERILKFFVSGNIPFNQVNDQHFRDIISLININDKPACSPSRTTLRARLSKYSKLGVDDLKCVLAANDWKINQPCI